MLAFRNAVVHSVKCNEGFVKAGMCEACTRLFPPVLDTSPSWVLLIAAFVFAGNKDISVYSATLKIQFLIQIKYNSILFFTYPRMNIASCLYYFFITCSTNVNLIRRAWVAASKCHTRDTPLSTVHLKKDGHCGSQSRNRLWYKCV